MARPKGATNADFELKRQQLLGRLLTGLIESDGPPSLRGLAQAAGVSVPTLRHYFGDREAVVAAVFAFCRDHAADELRIAATPEGPVDKSIAALLRHAVAGLEYGGLGHLNELGLREGLANAATATAYLSDVLDPTLQAFATRIASHVDSGELRALTPRTAAMQLLAPLLLAFLHQHSLGGAATNPIDLDTLIEDIATTFVRGNRSSP